MHSKLHRCAGIDTVAALKDGQEVTIRKKHQRGQYVASGSAGEFTVFNLCPFGNKVLFFHLMQKGLKSAQCSYVTCIEIPADHSVKIWDTTPAIDGRTQQLRRPVATLQKHKSYVSHVSFPHLFIHSQKCNHGELSEINLISLGRWRFPTSATCLCPLEVISKLSFGI